MQAFHYTKGITLKIARTNIVIKTKICALKCSLGKQNGLSMASLLNLPFGRLYNVSIHSRFAFCEVLVRQQKNSVQSWINEMPHQFCLSLHGNVKTDVRKKRQLLIWKYMHGKRLVITKILTISTSSLDSAVRFWIVNTLFESINAFSPLYFTPLLIWTHSIVECLLNTKMDNIPKSTIIYKTEVLNKVCAFNVINRSWIIRVKG